MNITISVLPGTSLEKALQEAKDFAIKMDMDYVYFKFNGVDFSINKNCNVERAYEKYFSFLDRNITYITD